MFIYFLGLDTADPECLIISPVPGVGVEILPAVMEVIRTVDVVVPHVPDKATYVVTDNSLDIIT